VAQILIRRIDDELMVRLEQRAALNSHRVQDEVRQILRDAVMENNPPIIGIGSRLAARFRQCGLETGLVEICQPIDGHSFLSGRSKPKDRI